MNGSFVQVEGWEDVKKEILGMTIGSPVQRLKKAMDLIKTEGDFIECIGSSSTSGSFTGYTLFLCRRGGRMWVAAYYKSNAFSNAPWKWVRAKIRPWNEG